ncbi:MAG: hypothetical protein ABSG29_12065, partial [Steroidobacteraceae bacterium]
MTEFWLHLQGFFEILFTRNVLTELAALAVCVGLGWTAAILLRNHEQFQTIKPQAAMSRTDLIAYVAIVIIPVIAVLGLVILARGILYAAHYDVTILDAAMRLVGAYIVIRVAVLLFAASLGNKSWMQNLENRLTLALWLAFAADYLGWLDPIIGVLDNIGIASGRTRVTVWSVLKLLFTLTL